MLPPLNLKRLQKKPTAQGQETLGNTYLAEKSPAQRY